VERPGLDCSRPGFVMWLAIVNAVLNFQLLENAENF
jgi:hypothetical protein